MTLAILRRLLASIATVLAIYVVTFLMVVTIPGNPLQQGQHSIPPEAEAALRARYQMDDNVAYFFQFLSGAFRLDFGPSFLYTDWTCNQIIASALPVSLTLGSLAILLALLVGVPLGVWSAVRSGDRLDRTIQSAIVLSVSIPSFVTGSILLMLLGAWWKLFPVGGWGTLWHLPLPVITLAIPYAAYIARLTRSGMIEVLGEDFIRIAFARGCSPARVIWRHALPVAILPIVAYLGPACASAMTGSFVVEKVFGVPGLGEHFVSAALNRDPGLIMSTVLVFAALLVCLNVFADLLLMWIDPRVRGAL